MDGLSWGYWHIQLRLVLAAQSPPDEYVFLIWLWKGLSRRDSIQNITLFTLFHLATKGDLPSMHVSSCFQAESPTHQAPTLISEEEQREQQTRTSHKLGAVLRVVSDHLISIIQYHQEEYTIFNIAISRCPRWLMAMRSFRSFSVISRLHWGASLKGLLHRKRRRGQMFIPNAYGKDNVCALLDLFHW